MFHTPDAKNSKCFVPWMWRPENVSCPHFPENLWNVSYPPLGLKKRQNVSYPLLKPRNGQNVSYPVFGTTLKNSASKKYLFTGRSTCLICCSVTLQIFLSHSPYHCSYVSHTVHTKACILDSAIYIVRHTVMNKLWGLRSTWNCYNKVRVPVSYLYFIVVWTFPSDDDRCKITKTSSLLLYCIRSYTSSFI
jgi:hypothetical protein